MSAFETSEPREVRLPQGTIRYREAGAGEPIVFVHGLLVNGLLWRKVVPALEAEFRSIVPDLPLGSHSIAMDTDAELTPPDLARLIADFIAALDLESVTLVGNDTGGALSQLVAVNHPERIGRLVLTNCDAYENFLPPAFRPLQWLAHVPGAVFAIAQSMRARPVQRLPIAYGWLTKRPIDPEVMRAYLRPVMSDRAVRRDVAKVLRGISNSYTLAAAQRFAEFDRPVLLAWGRDDRFFKPSYAERLAQAFPDARLEWIEDGLTFVPEEQAERVAELIGAFVRSAPAKPSAS